MTTIGIVRHGVTDWNQQGRAQGQHDVPLNREGLVQAELLAKRLAEEQLMGSSWDLIYSSHLIRAKVTAEIIARAMGVRTVEFDSRLREKTHGRLDGTTVEERVELWGEDWRELDHGEEKDSAMLERSLDFLQEITTLYPNGRILLVTHGAWIKTLLTELFKGKEITFLDNTCMTVIEKSCGGAHRNEDGSPTGRNAGSLPQEGWNCLLFNCTNHLQPGERTAVDKLG